MREIHNTLLHWKRLCSSQNTEFPLAPSSSSAIPRIPFPLRWHRRHLPLKPSHLERPLVDRLDLRRIRLLRDRPILFRRWTVRKEDPLPLAVTRALVAWEALDIGDSVVFPAGQFPFPVLDTLGRLWNGRPGRRRVVNTRSPGMTGGRYVGVCGE